MTHLVEKSANFAEKRKICITEYWHFQKELSWQLFCGLSFLLLQLEPKIAVEIAVFTRVLFIDGIGLWLLLYYL